ncbi:hypothetical protein [Sulfurovum sp.]|jgi:uncharacterized membrane protein|uniref:hypothetical protein n=1 Tax=Sulfurovum sp. TaxID=1969726 RepID=UPI002A36A3F7|nr:hypothetical protein [Sulfurovum sp.]MDD2451145.1 hypothetical protein [Sulfurovum sp.]MDD3500120.1 hypothetical protein [Sulfurovum sp.]MDY0401801.1 hypothetical protein [Sulfurovum sp.]
MSGWLLHLHLIAAISWIGGAIFMFILGLALRDKAGQKEVYPRIGPIYGYFEVVALILLLITGYMMIDQHGLLAILFSDITNDVMDALRMKLYIVGVIIVMTVIHMTISLMTIYKEKTVIQKLLSRGSSMGILLLNLWVLHYAMVLRDML